MRLRTELFIFSCLLLVFSVSCQKKSADSTFVFTAEGPPNIPVIISPTTQPTYSIAAPDITISGCFNAACGANVTHLTIQASGTGTLNVSDTGFTFSTSMLLGETRVFTFTATNIIGVVSAPATLTVSFNASFELSPLATLFNGGTSTNAPLTSASGNYVLNFLTSLPSLPPNPIVSGNYEYTSGALNPQ